MASLIKHYKPIDRALSSSQSSSKKIKAQKSAEEARKILGPLLNGEREHVFVLTAGQASLIDFLLACLERGGAKAISVWTWAIADYELLTMSDACARANGIKFRLIVDRASVLRQPQFLLWFREKFGPDAIRVTVTHAKIATVEYHDGMVVTIRGSANLNNNPRCEQMDICSTRDVFQVVRGVEDELWRTREPLRAEDCQWNKNNEEFLKVFGGVEKPEVKRKEIRMPLI